MRGSTPLRPGGPVRDRSARDGGWPPRWAREPSQHPAVARRTDARPAVPVAGEM